jgi:hypothetical protein
MRQILFIALLTCVLCCYLPGCGDSDSGSGGGGSSASGGAATPEALIERMKKAATSKDMGEMFACVYPEHRAGMAFFMGVMPIQMMIGMAEMFSGVGEGEQADDMKSKLATMKTKHAAILKKYGVPEFEEDDKSLDMSDQAGMLKLLDERMGDMDHVGFVKESMALLDEHQTEGQQKGGGPAEEMEKEFKKDVAEIKKDGDDKATVRFEGEETPKVLMRRVGGRWYLCLEQPGE